MNLQDLVPPLELCKLIPKGEFEDSALLWFSNYHFGGWHIEKRELAAAFTDNGELYPAPTLQEILKKFVVWDMKDKNNESKGSVISGLAENYGVNNVVTKWYPIPKTAEEALELWLKLKGIKTNENE